MSACSELKDPPRLVTFAQTAACISPVQLCEHGTRRRQRHMREGVTPMRGHGAPGGADQCPR